MVRGVSRDIITTPTGSTTIREAAWYSRGQFFAERMMPDTLYDAGICLPKSLFTSLRQRVTSRLYDQSQGVTANRNGIWYDTSINVPNLGNNHAVYLQDSYQYSNWQQHFMQMVFGWLHDNHWLSANEEVFFDWLASHCQEYSTNLSSIHPVFGGRTITSSAVMAPTFMARPSPTPIRRTSRSSSLLTRGRYWIPATCGRRHPVHRPPFLVRSH